MTGFNHAATGMLIGAAFPFPLCIPVAGASHFALDSLPHYGIPQEQRNISKFWKNFFTADFILTCGLSLLGLYYNQPAMFWAGVASCAPDVFWVHRILRTRSFDLSNNQTRFTKWHAGIQHFERPWGLWIEIPYSVAAFCTVAWVFAR